MKYWRWIFSQIPEWSLWNVKLIIFLSLKLLQRSPATISSSSFSNTRHLGDPIPACFCWPPGATPVQVHGTSLQHPQPPCFYALGLLLHRVLLQGYLSKLLELMSTCSITFSQASNNWTLPLLPKRLMFKAQLGLITLCDNHSVTCPIPPTTLKSMKYCPTAYKFMLSKACCFHESLKNMLL